ncbi:MAG TPA: alpha/beta hydrolase [Patescibacteria group bacterium]|nr:alpha/beta hydrolase [Patescibacteria group bacterium]
MVEKEHQTYSESKYRDVLWFADAPPGDVVYFEKSIGEYAMEGRILYNQAHEEPWVLSIHGARADFTKSDAVTFGLQRRGYSLLGMNLSGHSRAGVLKPEQTTLGNNVREVEAFYQLLDGNRKKVVVAYSLGGTPALKLLENHSDNIAKLILFYPGIYTRDAYDKHFGEEFRTSITKPFSYRNTDTIDLLRRFRGDLLLIKGQYDGLDPKEYGKPEGGAVGEVEIGGNKYYSPIPKDVIDMVYEEVPDSQFQLIEIPKCGHSVVLWMRDHPAEAELLLDKIEDFLDT